MINKAIDKLKAEMKQNSSDQYINIIGEFLIQHLNHNQDAAEKILVEGKSIGKSIDEMASVARKKASKGRALLTDREGFEIVLKYYGISGKVSIKNVSEVKFESPTEKELQAKPVINFDVKLDDFM